LDIGHQYRKHQRMANAPSRWGIGHALHQAGTKAYQAIADNPIASQSPNDPVKD
jgi:hypothetical protein